VTVIGGDDEQSFVPSIVQFDPTGDRFESRITAEHGAD